METSNLLSLAENLEDNIEDLEENLEPLLTTALGATTKKLPVLDKAKLYILIVYSIESLLFSYLRLNGVEARSHAVFKELTRVKQYFEKIKVAEAGPERQTKNISLNKQAAGRFIKHALAGNEKYDLERAEREARERALAKAKLKKLGTNPHTNNHPEGSAKYKQQSVPDKHQRFESSENSDTSSSSASSDSDQDGNHVKQDQSSATEDQTALLAETGDQLHPRPKPPRISELGMHLERLGNPSKRVEDATRAEKRKAKKGKNQRKKEKAKKKRKLAADASG